MRIATQHMIQVEGRWSTAKLVEVPVDAIDLSDETFQYRSQVSTEGLRQSLARDGLHEPIHLLAAMPHRVVDGFRRVTAIRQLGWRTVRAFVHDELTEEKAHALAFVNNVVRKNLSPLEKAQGIRIALQRGRDRADIARSLGLSEKQVRRYEMLVDLSPDLQILVDTRRVTMAHARVLASSDADNLGEWALKAADNGWSASELRTALASARARHSAHRKLYLRIESNVLRVFPFHVRRDSPQAVRERVVSCLEEALAFLKR